MFPPLLRNLTKALFGLFCDSLQRYLLFLEDSREECAICSKNLQPFHFLPAVWASRSPLSFVSLACPVQRQPISVCFQMLSNLRFRQDCRFIERGCQHKQQVGWDCWWCCDSERLSQTKCVSVCFRALSGIKFICNLLDALFDCFILRQYSKRFCGVSCRDEWGEAGLRCVECRRSRAQFLFRRVDLSFQSFCLRPKGQPVNIPAMLHRDELPNENIVRHKTVVIDEYFGQVAPSRMVLPRSVSEDRSRGRSALKDDFNFNTCCCAKTLSPGDVVRLARAKRPEHVAKCGLTACILRVDDVYLCKFAL